jgi:hypothetical protein
MLAQRGSRFPGICAAKGRTHPGPDALEPKRWVYFFLGMWYATD